MKINLRNKQNAKKTKTRQPKPGRKLSEKLGKFLLVSGIAAAGLLSPDCVFDPVYKMGMQDAAVDAPTIDVRKDASKDVEPDRQLPEAGLKDVEVADTLQDAQSRDVPDQDVEVLQDAGIDSAVDAYVVDAYVPDAYLPDAAQV